MILSILPEQTVLISGGTGSLGEQLLAALVEQEQSNLVEKIFPFSKPRQAGTIRVFSRDEKKQYDLKQKFPSVDFIIGNISNFHSIRNAVRDMDIIIHAAALKYVDVSEKQPSQYIDVNVCGTQNLIAAVMLEENVSKCIGISSDKACNPINVYGMTKLLLEKLFIQAQDVKGTQIKTDFLVARYGNVIGTRGSVLPFWQKQRNSGKPLFITNPKMTRFLFTLQEAVELIDFALGCQGGIVVSKAMGAASLGELAKIMASSLDGTKEVRIEEIGSRGGEKLHEELFSEEEWSHVSLNYEPFFVLNPKFKTEPNQPRWTSDSVPRISGTELRDLIKDFLV